VVCSFCHTETGLNKEDTVSGNHAVSREADSSPNNEPRDEVQPADFAINAKVRHVLARRWVRKDGLEVGTTDGVVFLRGNLDREPGGPPEEENPMARERFLWRLRNELLAIPGVMEVVMDVTDSERTDIPWRGTRG
jgi:hypothetical protein